MATAIINYKCPNCAAPMVFGIASQKWECHFCFSTFTADELSQIEANKGEKIEEADWQADSFQAENTVAYSCPDCGGRMLTDPHTVATFCIYCHSPAIIADRLTGEYQPVYLIPFKQEKETAIRSVQKLCKGKPFLPKPFREAVRNGEIEGLYVPYWLFSANITADMEATGKMYTVWRDSTYEYTKTDTYHVQRKAYFPFRRVPADASSRMDDRLLEAIEPFRYHDMIPFSMEYLSGHFAESFDVDAATCQNRFQQRASQGIGNEMRALANRYQTLTVNNLTSRTAGQETHYVMFPIWTVSVKYKKKIYTYAMNGQTEKSAGTLPISWGRVFAWLGGLFGALLLGITLIGGFML